MNKTKEQIYADIDRIISDIDKAQVDLESWTYRTGYARGYEIGYEDGEAGRAKEGAK